MTTRKTSQRHPIQNDVLMFVTTNTKNRKKVFAHAPFAREAIDRLYRVQYLYPFTLFGFVIMPDHIHLLLHVPAPNSISRVMHIYKLGLTYDVGIGAFWQKRFDLRMPEHGYAALRYIHNNPVKASLSKTIQEYPWSSASGRYDVTNLSDWY